MARKSDESSAAVAEQPTTARPTNQSAFIREFLAQDSSASYRDVAQAWADEGQESTLNSSLFYQIRTQLGLSRSSRRGRPAGRSSSPNEPNRSEYIRKNLLENPELTANELTAQWKEEGFPGELNPSLYYQVKRRMGLSNSRRGRRPGRPAKVATTSAPVAKSAKPAGSREKVYTQIEKSLDDLIGNADSIGDSALAQALRKARRHASSALV